MRETTIRIVSSDGRPRGAEDVRRGSGWRFLPALCVAQLIASVGCGERSGAASSIATVTATRGDLVFRSSFYGEIEAKDAHPVFAPDLKNLWQVTVESVLADGTPVKKGDTVLTFARGALEADRRDRETELAVAVANERRVIAEYDEQEIARTLALRRSELAADLARLAVVEGKNLISKIDLEKAKVELTRALLQVELDTGELAVLGKKRAAALDAEAITVKAARQKLDDINTQLERMSVRALTSGVLFAPYTRLNWTVTKVAPGKVVRPGDKILEIPELDAFVATIFVRQRDAAQLNVGDTAVVVPTMFPDVALKGVVIARDDFATTRNERSGTTTPGGTLKELRVVLDLSADDAHQEQLAALRPGGTVRADLSTTLVKDAVLVPLAALRERGDAMVVVDTDGVERPVTVGKTSLTHAEIRSGVVAGDVVVLQPTRKEEAARRPATDSSSPQ